MELTKGDIMASVLEKPKQMTFPGWREKLIETSIETVKHYEPKDRPYYGCFSGGKDSVVLKDIVRRAGVAVEWHYNVTTIDPPELVKFIKREHSDVKFRRPPESFFKLGRRKGFPTRRVRWCCEKLKENSTPKGNRILLGIRAAESPRRAANWTTFTFNHKIREYAVNPILLWKDSDVWTFIKGEGLRYCELYDEGFKRLGCIGCPMAGPKGMKRQFARWPKYEKAWKNLFKFTWNRRTGSSQRDGRIWFGDRHFDNWEEMWEWWLNDEPLSSDECQGGLELFS